MSIAIKEQEEKKFEINRLLFFVLIKFWKGKYTSVFNYWD